MPRKYSRKSDRAQWSEEDLRAAAEALKYESRSANSVAKEFGIPLRILLRRVRAGKFKKTGLGLTAWLGEKNEQKFVEYIQREPVTLQHRKI